MSGKIFFDTNIFVYAYTAGDIVKHTAAKKILQDSKEYCVISTQVLNEFYVTLAKYKIEHEKIVAVVSEITSFCEIHPVKLETVNGAFEIKKKYGFSYWDSLILSATLENSCSLLYSEDMQNGQVVENTLKIVNPFNKT
jgi:predicted nucleic acid-binding protein